MITDKEKSTMWATLTIIKLICLFLALILFYSMINIWTEGRIVTIWGKFFSAFLWIVYVACHSITDLIKRSMLG